MMTEKENGLLPEAASKGNKVFYTANISQSGKARNVPIVEAVNRYSGIELKKKGKNLWGLCPIHGEKSPSFSVDPEKNVWHCFGCGTGGSSVDFVMKLKNVNFKESCKQIENDFNLHTEWKQKPRIITKSPESVIDEKIKKAFDFCFESRRTLLAELSRYNTPETLPEIMVRDLGRLEIIMEELVSDNAKNIANGLKLFRRYYSWVR